MILVDATPVCLPFTLGVLPQLSCTRHPSVTFFLCPVIFETVAVEFFRSFDVMFTLFAWLQLQLRS
jgi:hypothetical protein